MKGFRFECYNNEKFKLDEALYCSTHPHNTFNAISQRNRNNWHVILLDYIDITII